MATVDGDWTCERDDFTYPGCHAIWQDCDGCLGDECPHCQGMGGGFVCGLHDLGEPLDVGSG